TYIRSLCHDLGKALGSCAAMSSLVRTKSGPFLLEDAVTPEELSEAAKNGRLSEMLLPPEFVLSEYPAVSVNNEVAAKLKNGLRMRPGQLGIREASVGDTFRIYEGETLLMLSQVITEKDTLVLSILKTFF
ncbi:MAG: pseudouridine synthase, partial [Clostridia bacterium]|nr:pseudouridine synthase [Clostridia bacterium]